jgi:NAD(P)-dependent dehydrogenase (short-subunit alcohol dehydrogenase family)
MSKTIVITGASSGIGRATTIYFAEKGWNVAATMRSPEKEKELQKIDGIKVYQLDVTRTESISSAYDAILGDFGNVDVLLNNAGYPVSGPFEAATDEQIRRNFDVNVFGLFNTTRKFLEHFRPKGDGTIINVSSMGGKVTFPLISIYHSTKFAVEGFSESLSYELGEIGIKVKLIEPGNVATNILSSMVFARSKTIKEYDSFRKHFQQKYASSGPIFSKSEMVAEVIFEAANDNTDRLRYIVGEDAKQFITMREQQGDQAYVDATKKQFSLKSQ